MIQGSLPLLVGISATWGCIPSAGGPPGPVVSPTGIVYEMGTPPSQTRFSQTATLYLQSDQTERALELALEGIEEDPGNPVHHFLAGVASVRLGRYEEADRMFTEAERIYPAYELDVEPEREAGWAEAYNAGADAYASGSVEAAIAAWRGAAVIFQLRPEAHRNLATVLQIEGRYDEAARAYRGALDGLDRRPATRVLSEVEVAQRVEVREEVEDEFARLLLAMDRHAEAEPLLRNQLEREPGNAQVMGDLALALSGQGRMEEAAEIYTTLLSGEDLETTQLFNLGIALFRAEDFQRASEAFRRVTEVRPNSRDAWFNYANSLFAGGSWDTLSVVGERLLELDPLNENAALLTARALLEIGDEEGAIGKLDRIDGAPVHLDGLLMLSGDGEIVIRGQMAGNQADPGTPVRLRFSFYGDAGPMGQETLALEAPPKGERVSFEVHFPGTPVGYRYDLVP